MNRLLILPCAALLLPLASLHAADAPKPNIIFILADDLGWGDLGCYGHPHIRTPNLDAMAADGRLYTHFYANGPVCSPSRTAFMTGQFPSRLRVFGALGDDSNKEKGNVKFVDPAVPNMARILKQQGYATGHFGKWHLDTVTDPGAPAISQYGFDESRAHVATGPDFDEFEKKLPRGEGKNTRSSEWIMNASLDFLERHKQGPVFMNIWFMVPHASLNPAREHREGYKQFRSNGKQHDALLRKGVGGDITTPQEMYYPSVTEMDTQIGRLIQKLKEIGAYENTILLFSSDNGPESIHVAKAMHSGIGSPGVFRGQKRSLYDGGIRVPFIISWPKGGIPRGTADRELPVSGVDLLPSLLGLLNVVPPAKFNGDGEDVSAAFRGQPFSRKKPLFWEHRGGQTGYPLHFSPHLAMREGPWKLLMNPDGSRLELYDLQKQVMETDNLAAEFPEVAQRMKASLEDWRKTLPDPDNYFAEMKPSGWEALLSGGKMRKGRNAEAKRD
jgi:arylsulfatase A-like enzyme